MAGKLSSIAAAREVSASAAAVLCLQHECAQYCRFGITWIDVTPSLNADLLQKTLLGKLQRLDLAIDLIHFCYTYDSLLLESVKDNMESRADFGGFFFSKVSFELLITTID